MNELIPWLDQCKAEFASHILDIKLREKAVSEREQAVAQQKLDLELKEKELEQFRRVSFIASMNKQLEKKVYASSSWSVKYASCNHS